MSTNKGYPTQKKSLGLLPPYNERLVQTEAEFVTAQRTFSDKVLQDSAINGLYRLHTIAKALEAGSEYPKRVLKITAHGAKKGDVVRFEQTSTSPGFEAGVLSIPDVNTIILAAELPVDSIVGDEVFILRYVTALYGQNGEILVITTVSPITPNSIGRVNAATTNITTGATVPVIAALAVDSARIQISNTTGKTLKLYVGAVFTLYIPLEGLSNHPCVIPAGSALGVRSDDDTADVGSLIINTYK